MFETAFFRVMRSFSHNRFHALITLSVLVTGMTSCILVMLYLVHQTSFDAHHRNADRIFRLSTHIQMGEGGGETPQTSVHLGALLKREHAFLENYTRFHPFDFQSFKVQCQDKVFKETGILGAEPTVFQVFTHPMLAGNPTTALQEPYSVVLTRSLAEKYFATTACLGQSLQLDQQTYRVTGVIQDLPTNSDLRFQALVSHDFGQQEDWDDMKYHTYVLVKHEGDGRLLQQALQEVEENYIRPYYKQAGMNITLQLSATPLRKVHFQQGMVYDTPKSNATYVSLFLAIGLFILAIASFNYINLSAVESFKRSKEVAVKGVLGVRRGQIVAQFVGESLVLTFMSLLLSLLLVALLLPSFNTLSQIKTSFNAVFQGHSLLTLLLVIVLLGVVPAAVPAWYLTSFQLPKLLKGKLPTFNRGLLYRSLLVAQFAMSLTMITCTLAVYRQMNYMQEKNLGFLLDQVILIPLPEEIDHSKTITFKQALSQYPTLRQVSLVGPGSTPGSVDIEKHEAVVKRENGEDLLDVFNTIAVDEQYIALLKIQLVKGRNWNPLLREDIKHAFLVNEAFVRHAGWKEPIGKVLGFHQGGKIIGVVKDYHYKSLHNPIEPLILYYNQGGPNNELLVKTKTERDIELLKQTWQQHMGKSLFSFSFLDQRFNKQYQQEKATMTLFFLFSLLAIALICLGLFGLSSLVTKQRIKEIGIRRVLGGSRRHITYVLLKDIVLVLSSGVILAAPLAGYAIEHWQRNFAYPAVIGPWVYLLAWGVTLVTTLSTAFYHTFKAVNTSPALTLRTE